MFKLALLPLALSVAFAGCQVFKKSETWDRVTQVRVPLGAGEDPSSAHAQRLHEVLQAGGVEHKVVNFHATNGGGSRTAVIYRDETNPRSPWWLMDSTMRQPTWLPNDSLEKQVRFAVRQPVTISSVEEHRPGAADQGPSQIASSSQRNNRPARISSADQPERTVRAGDRDTLSVPPSSQAARTRVPDRAAESTSAAPASRSMGDRIRAFPGLFGIRRIQRSEVETSRPAHETAPVTTSAPDYAELFRSQHGSSYDSASSVDRQKMALLKGRPTAPGE